MSNKSISNFLEYLESEEVLSSQKITRLEAALLSSTHPFDLVVTELGLMTEEILAKHMSKFLVLKHLDANNLDLSKLSNEVDTTYLEERGVLPLEKDEQNINLLMANPFDTEAIDMMGYFHDLNIVPVVGPRTKVISIINQFRNSLALTEPEILTTENEELTNIDLDRLQNIAREAPIIQLVNRIIQQALTVNATDIHLEPWEDLIKIRFRKDGILINFEDIKKSSHAGLVTRIKILSGLNISERRLPQDGRMRISIRGQETDFRVSIMPSIHGETIVIRVLERSSDLLALENLGFKNIALQQLEKLLFNTNGIFLVTGPTGSGKTTTLYSLIKKLDLNSLKVFTVEDPVEYRLEGITQLQVDTAIELDFANALRSVLRQDPDVILIGEIRDVKTANIAIQAALTGHLVLATLHTNSAIGAITRLRDMGIEDFLLSATLRGVLSQRLIRKTCQNCNSDSPCKHCNDTEFDGRTVVYEIAEISNEISNAISDGVGQAEIEKASKQGGMVSIFDNAKKLVVDGVTTQGEITRVLEMEVIDD